MTTAVSGMAASIRSATESETFDLAGNSTSTITTTIQSAFSTPFTHLGNNNMIRITFITGAGKLARQKYDENAAKTVTSTLRDLGYVEDRGASCVVECGGMFKLQHDTGKNLKTVVVFPMIGTGNNTESDYGEDNDNKKNNGKKDFSTGNAAGTSLLEQGSQKELIALSSNTSFQKLIPNKCPSWNQKRHCLTILTELKSLLDSLDSKLVSGSILSDAEQTFYDTVSIDSIDMKMVYIKEEMKNHVDQGRITKFEKDKLIKQANDRLDILSVDIEQATKENKMKKVQNLTVQKEKVRDRIEMLKQITTISPLPLRYESDISKLIKEMQPLIKLEQETKGRLLSIKETTQLARKEEIEDEILSLEDQSRGWFEEDEEFQLRLDASRAKVNTAVKKTVKKTTSSSIGNRTTNKKQITNWVVPGAGKKQTAKKSIVKKSAVTNAFAAMMMDSDSDSD